MSSSTARGSMGEVRDVDVSLVGDHFWGVAFAFRDSELERRYRDESLNFKHRYDVAAYAQGLLPGNVIAYTCRKYFGPVGLVNAVFNSLFCLSWLCLAVWKRETYMKWRDVIVCWVILHGMSMFIFLVKTEDPPSPTWLATLGRIILKSPVLVSLYTSLNLSMFVRKHALIELATIPILLVWTVDFCAACCPAGEPENAVIRGIGEIIQLSLVFLSSFFLSREIECSCFTTVSSIVVLMGVLVPIAFVYMLDISRRKTFISQHHPEKMSAELNRSMSHSSYSIWYVVLLVENIWMGCCVLVGL